MEYKNLYNSKYTIITQGNIGIDIPSNFDVYNEDLINSSYTIDNHQIYTDQLYNGHFIFKNSEDINNFNFNNIDNIDIINNNIYVKSAVHHGEYKKCLVDDSIIICNSYCLPIIANVSKTSDTLYGTILNHRLSIKLIPQNIFIV
jgi:hypothetical protein